MPWEEPPAERTPPPLTVAEEQELTGEDVDRLLSEDLEAAEREAYPSMNDLYAELHRPRKRGRT